MIYQVSIIIPIDITNLNKQNSSIFLAPASKDIVCKTPKDCKCDVWLKTICYEGRCSCARVWRMWITGQEAT